MSSEATECFNAAADFIGRDWLESQRELHFSNDKQANSNVPEIVESYRNVLQVLGRREADDLLNTLEGEHELFQKIIYGSAANFLYLGRDIKLLDDAKIVDLDGSPLDRELEDVFQHRLHDKQEFSKARFEISVGAYYSKNGCEVHFVDEAAISHQTPDILIDYEPFIWVECKKLDTASSKIVRERDLLHKLLEELSALLQDRCQPHTIALLDIDSEVTPRMQDRISNQLPNTLDPKILSEYDLTFGRLFLTEMNVPSENLENGNVMLKSETQNPKHHHLFYEKLVQPRLAESFGIEAPKEKVLPQWVRAVNQGGNENIHYWTDPVWMGCKYDFGYNYASQLGHQVDEIGGKFRRDLPNIVNIDLSAIGIGLLPDWNLLLDTIQGEIEFTSRISVAVISFEVLDHGEIEPVEGSIPARITRYQLIDNPNAATQLPDEFVDRIWRD